MRNPAFISFAIRRRNRLNGTVEVQKDELIRTRTTLIKRLKNLQDQASWQEFFDIYWKLIYGVARKSGLIEAEAKDVVQETMMSVAKHMPNFNYDRNRGSFKAWLLNMTRWRIADQIRKRLPVCRPLSFSDDASDSTKLAELENIPDQSKLELESLWDTEWKEAIVEAAKAKVKRDINPLHFQIFDLYVNKEWEPVKIAKKFGVRVRVVYVTKTRVSKSIKEEVDRLIAATC